MEKVKLGEIFEYLPKSKLKAGDGKEEGKYKFFTSSNRQNKFIDDFLYEGEYIIFGTGGKASINYCNGKFSTSTDNFVVKVNQEFSAKLIYLYFKNDMAKLENGFKGASIKHISKEYINQLTIPKYNYQNQLEIIRKLDKIQEIIDIRKMQIEELDKLIKAQFIEMFGDPILNPMKWEVKKLGELSNKVMSGNTPKGGDRVYVSFGIEFYRSQNVWKNKIEKCDIAYIDEETHKKMAKSSLKHNDLLITKTGRINTENSSLGRTALYIGEDNKANINGHIYLVRLNKGENHELILRILISDEYREYIRSVCVGGIDKRQLNKEHIENFPIIYPPIELQNQFTEIVKQIEEQKLEIQKSLEKMEKLQESLMNKYFL